MKIRVETDPDLKEPELVIRAKDQETAAAMKSALAAPTAPTLPVFQDTVERFLPLPTILFIETQDRTLQVHTKDDIFTSKQKLYELAESLPGSFMQVAKSVIINLNQVAAINRSLSDCLVEFQNSHKQVYASRRYYKALVERLNEMRGL
ncbi:LytTR family DNA-binding domain-containing protein [Lacticaseibacillus hegangensis]|uniref:LytTR family DNA-binding domain-containing protein n=1 Tax=Lacticaseibacillus hegangensis TaxID=2486010 RepID=A0ABW4CTD6_9LACO|nr:LytTR family DNA-binding domain-containing protein [Lacticaseibacillus hegangensis]